MQVTEVSQRQKSPKVIPSKFVCFQFYLCLEVKPLSLESRILES